MSLTKRLSAGTAKLATTRKTINQMHKEKTSSILYSPWVFLFLAFLVFAARWVWIAGFQDYAWTYEPAKRILDGEVQYRDFILTHPPLANYTLAAMMYVFGNSLWVYSIHLYIWWVLALIVGLLIVEQMGANKILAIAAVLLAVSVSLVNTQIAHAHNFAPTAIAGLSILYILRYSQQRKLISIGIAGFFAGLCILAKQNVGLAITSAGFLSLVYLYFLSKNRTDLSACGCYFGGWLVGFFPSFIYFVENAGLRETFFQIFMDFNPGKGGLLNTAARALPRIILNPITPYQRLVELFISLIILISFLIIFYIIISPRYKDRIWTFLNKSYNNVDHLDITLFLFLYFIVLIILSITSIYNIAEINFIRNFITLKYISSYLNLSLMIINIMAFSFFMVFLINKSIWNNPKDIIPAILMIALASGHNLSGLHHIPSGAPVTIPIFVFLLARTRLSQSVPRLAVILAIFMIVLFYLFPLYNITYAPLKKLPGHSPFAGLYARAEFQKAVKGMLSEVSTRIKGKRTLWLCWPGPHSALGGEHVFNVAFMMFDTYSTRSERRLENNWKMNPPEFVVLSPLLTSKNPNFLTQESLLKWLNASYIQVWAGKGWGDKDFSLWEKNSKHGLSRR